MDRPLALDGDLLVRVVAAGNGRGGVPGPHAGLVRRVLEGLRDGPGEANAVFSQKRSVNALRSMSAASVRACGAAARGLLAGLAQCSGTARRKGMRRPPDAIMVTSVIPPTVAPAAPNANADRAAPEGRRAVRSRARSVEAGARGRVEHVLVARLGDHVDRLGQTRDVLRLGADDEALAAAVVSGVAVHIGLGAELLDEVDLDRDAAGGLGAELAVLGPDADGDLLFGALTGGRVAHLAREREGDVAEQRAALGELDGLDV